MYSLALNDGGTGLKPLVLHSPLKLWTARHRSHIAPLHDLHDNARTHTCRSRRVGTHHAEFYATSDERALACAQSAHPVIYEGAPVYGLSAAAIERNRRRVAVVTEIDPSLW